MQKSPRSLRAQLVRTLLLNWVFPVLLIMGGIGWYSAHTMTQQNLTSLEQLLRTNLNMGADRLDSAISASRIASSDTTIKEGWQHYQQDASWATLYRATGRFLNSQYENDIRFRFATFTYHDNHDQHRVGVYNQGLQVPYRDLQAYWSDDHDAIQLVAEALDTGLAFYQSDSQLYLIRNVLSSNFQPIGTLVLALNPDYYFSGLSLLPWSAQVDVTLDDLTLPLLQTDAPAGDIVSYASTDREYHLSATVSVDAQAIDAQAAGYRILLCVVALFVLPLLAYVLYFFDRNITRPVDTLTASNRELEQGHLGCQTPVHHQSAEFQYLAESFNQMSGQLQTQFDRLYQEELALRDAKIKALQSHINPHFLNNTLEIINWESRMHGDVKVSKMIEALSTLLDAAIARDKRKTVTLAEEMGYVSAYLYIVDQRFGKRLTVSQAMSPDTLDIQVPRLILQPLVENAVEHGIGPSGQGTISIESRLKDGHLLIDVTNNGDLSPQDEAQIRRLLSPDYDTSQSAPGNVGIANVNQRIRILYGPQSGLEIGVSHGQVVARLTIVLPE